MQAQLWVARAGKNPFINLSGLFKKQDAYGYLHLKNWTALTIIDHHWAISVKVIYVTNRELTWGATSMAWPCCPSSSTALLCSPRCSTSALVLPPTRGAATVIGVSGLSGFRFLISGYATSFTKKDDSNQHINQINSVCPLWKLYFRGLATYGPVDRSLFANGNLMVKLSKWKWFNRETEKFKWRVSGLTEAVFECFFRLWILLREEGSWGARNMEACILCSFCLCSLCSLKSSENGAKDSKGSF